MKYITEEGKQEYRTFLEGIEGAFIIGKNALDVIERCKLPIAIKFRKKLGYNHNDITVREEISIAEKTIKLFPHENIALNKKFNNRKPNIQFKHHDTTVEVNERNHENYDTDDEKEKKEMFKRHNFDTFECNPNDPNFDLYNFLGETDSCITKLSEKKL